MKGWLKGGFATWMGWGSASFSILLVAVLQEQPSAGRYLRLVADYDPVATASQGPVPEDRLSVIEDLQVRAGDTLSQVLARANLPAEIISRIIRETNAFIDLRRIRPSDSFQMHRTRDGEFTLLRYQRTPEEYVEVEREGGSFRASRHKRPVERAVRKLEGEVEASLYLTMTRAGADPSLVVEFADLFSWDFDFFTETENGDRFRLLVEERRVDGETVGYGRILAGEYLPKGRSRPLEAYYFAWDDNEDARGYYDAEGRSVRKFFLKSPLNYRRISSHFTYRRLHPIFKTIRAHLGVDYAAPTGTPVVALGHGRVVQSGWITGFGNTLQVRHNDTYLTQYAHLSRFAPGVRAGSRVAQGQVIGFVGSTGHATGPHLDFRVRENGRWVDPLALKSGSAEPLPAAYREQFRAQTRRSRELLESLAPGHLAPLAGREPGAPPSGRLDTSPPS